MNFAQAIIQWQQQYGRQDLPWQLQRTPYRVWLSEVMLQQTQVATVIPYFVRFTERFSTVAELAAAQLDDLLTLWSGLGYYARCRHLQRAAQMVVSEFNGEFPATATALQRLPGVGRSTAAAILSLAFGHSAAILDGNVRRILCRYFAISGAVNHAATQQQLWQLAEDLLPPQQGDIYTQGVMDLGALICRRHTPLCSRCPLQSHCLAHTTDTVAAYPQAATRKERPQRHCYLLLIEQNQHYLLLQRPPSGIWGGLWSPPEWSPDLKQITAVEIWCQQKLGLNCTLQRQLPPITHDFTHFRLHLEPLLLQLKGGDLHHVKSTIKENGATLWYKCAPDSTAASPAVALPTPIKRLFAALANPPNSATGES
ncbi:MAG: A/G-specific adenine glycosylase [Gammaproteobacteria bacterium]|nr:A/G-specific adenine glycosylase [Gammaproteobacteria bacterium]